VLLETEEELDLAWNKLIEGGSVLMPLGNYDWSRKYGWVQDRFGVNWQLSFGKMQDVGQQFTPTLMFTGEQQGNAGKAVQFYTSVFDNSSVVGILHYGKDDEDEEGTIKHAQFILDGTVFMAMDSSMSHDFKFNEAISFVVNCNTQQEIDYYWSKLSEGGSEGQCGWLKDQFGVSWQVVPAILGELMNTPGKSERVMQAFMKMKKFDIEALQNA
jgi:predicted 3-demethylubiquinone-9 3-methyltransferase (glyoxalase superfamily)